MDSDNDALIRRYLNNIRISGVYYILFGVWTALKILILSTMNRKYAAEIFAGIDPDIEEWIVKLVYAVLFLIMFFIVMMVHLYVGLNALKFSKGKTKKKGFLIVSVFIIGIHILAIISSLDEIKDISDTVIASILLDLTAVYLLSDMIYSAVKVKSIRKGQG